VLTRVRLRARGARHAALLDGDAAQVPRCHGAILRAKLVTLDEAPGTDPAHPATSREPARSGQGILQSARDGWAVGGAAFDLARRAHLLRPYVAGALGLVVVIEAAIAAGGVALRHEGTLVQRIVFGLLAGCVAAVVSNATAVGLVGLADEVLAGRDPEPALGWRLAVRRLPQVAGRASILAVALFRYARASRRQSASPPSSSSASCVARRRRRGASRGASTATERAASARS